MSDRSVPEPPGEARDGPARGGVIRVAHRRGYTVLDNTAVRHPELSFMATGVLAYLLSLPDGATMRSDRLAQLPGKEGRDAVRRCLRELEAAGFLVRERRQDERGRWYTVQTIFEVPVAGAGGGSEEAQVAPKTDFQAPVIPPDAKAQVTPKTGFQASENQASVDRTSVDRASVDQALRDQVPRSSTKNPPNPTAHAMGDKASSSQDATGHGRPRRRSPRAEGTNPRAVAQRNAETAQRAQLLEAAQAYGTRTAQLDVASTADDFRARLLDERARDPRSGWDDERIDAAVASFVEARSTTSTPAPPELDAQLTLDAVETDDAIPSGRGSDLAARAARIAQRVRRDVDDAQPNSSTSEATQEHATT